MALTLVLSGFAMPGSIGEGFFLAYAADLTPPDWATMKTAIESASTGETINITLSGNIVSTGTISIPEGVKVVIESSDLNEQMLHW